MIEWTRSEAVNMLSVEVLVLLKQAISQESVPQTLYPARQSSASIHGEPKNPITAPPVNLTWRLLAQVQRPIPSDRYRNVLLRPKVCKIRSA